MVKVERSYPAPLSLAEEKKKASGSYCKADVVNQLRHDFGNKCYLCEISELQDPQVEHLIPHKGTNRDLEFDWDNLFLSCGHCNNVKNQREYDEGIIDCCKIDPETVLDFHFDMEAVHITTKRDNDKEALRTAKLLNSIYNKSNTGLRVLKCETRVIQLYGQMNELYKLLTAHRDNPNDKLVMRKLSIVLNRKSAFAAFKRQFIRDNIADYPELEEYLA